VQVSFERPDSPVHVSGDADEIGTVLNNLVSNAVKYTRPGGRVDVAFDASEQWTQVSVADTGIGISDVDRTHLFSTFHRSSNPEALSLPGTGLGLAISRRIAEAHGGRIEVESTLGRGSTFRLVLPTRETGPE
jgi:signal transduction histidine kinase